MATILVPAGKSISKATSRASAGDTVILAPGTVSTEDIYISKPLNLVGNGAKLSSLMLKNLTGGSVTGINASGKVNSTDYTAKLRSLESSWSIGIKLSRCSAVKILQCSAQNYMAGIDFENCHGCSVSGSQATLCALGFRFSASEGCQANNCQAANNLRLGFQIYSGLKCEFNSCQSSNEGLHDFIVLRGAANNIIRDCQGSGSGAMGHTMATPGPSSFNFFDVGPGNRAINCRASERLDPTGTDGNGFIADTSNYGVSFESCSAFNCRGSGIRFTQTNNCIVSGLTVISGCKDKVHIGRGVTGSKVGVVS